MRKIYHFPLIVLLIFLAASGFSHDGIKKGFHFTENKGQFDQNIVFHSKLHVGSMFLEKDRFTFDLYSAEQMNSLFKRKHNSKEEKNGIPVISKRQPELNPSEIEKKFKKHSYSMIFNGANANPTILPDLMLSGTKNYFIGNDQSKWVHGAKSFKAIRYNELYNNIDMEIYSEFEWMKYDFIVHPGGDPNDIQINYEGVNGLRINENGELIIQLSTGEIKEVKLKAYQDINGERTSVSCYFNKDGNHIYAYYDYNKSVTHSFKEGSAGDFIKHIPINWSQMSSEAQYTLNNQSFGNAITPVKDGRFTDQIDEAWDALGF